MKIQQIAGCVSSYFNKNAKKVANNKPNAKFIKEQKEFLLELRKRQQEKAQEIHPFPELNSLGLPKWM